MLVGLGLACQPGRAAAFSDFNRYQAPTAEGGTAGRHFTGSPLDGYGCDACHQGADGIEVGVTGVPLDGYQPGASYEITLRFLDPDPHVSMLLEFVDEQQRTAGTLAPPDVATIPPEEFCMEEGVMTFPALMPISLPDTGRNLIGVADCGARAVRFVWTAPSAAVGTIWMAGGVVNSDEGADARGDGVTLVRRPLLSGAGQAYAREVASGCAIAGARADAGPRWLVCFWVAVAVRMRHRRATGWRSSRAQVSEVGS